MYENFSFLVPCFAVFLPHFHIEFFFLHTQCLFAKCTGRKRRKKNEKKYISDLYRVARTLFYDEHKGRHEKKSREPRGKKNINTYQFFCRYTILFLHCCCCCSSSIRNQNIYQQWNENGMDRWLQINENKNILVLLYDMQVP